MTEEIGREIVKAIRVLGIVMSLSSMSLVIIGASIMFAIQGR